MRTFLVLAIHLVTSIAKLLGPGGARGLVAETLLANHQLLAFNPFPPSGGEPHGLRPHRDGPLFVLHDV
jgi:hypothetical protein